MNPYLTSSLKSAQRLTMCLATRTIIPQIAPPSEQPPSFF